MIRPVEVRPLPNYRIWLRYADGTEGEVDLSHLAGQGVFAVWQEEGVFAVSTERGRMPELCLAILGGRLPARALGMVTEWASLHQRDLLDRGTQRLL
jgi:hypothetical protein